MTDSKVIIVRGRVQGVGYRYSTMIQARALGLHGFVRNMPDSSVYIYAQGDPEAVRQLIGWCGTGPSRAAVESVHVEDFPEGKFTGFQIR